MNLNAIFVSAAGWRRFWLVLALGWLAFPGWAQDAETGTITGRVVDSWQGNPVPGVTVLVRGTTLGTVTDSVGTYTLQKVPPGTYAVAFSRSGYTGASVGDVKVAAGQRTPVDYSLKPEFFQMETFEAVAEPIMEQGVQLMLERQQATVTMDAIGSAQFSKAGVSDAAEALAKVTGATIVDGKFAVIRGLSDRYTSATLNGAEIPSADPYRKSAQLDLFPSAMIDRVTVSKTFTPDQPGGFTGGAIDIVSKSFPEKFFANFTIGGAFNTQATQNDRYLQYRGGAFDWAGMDDGTRAQPDILKGVTTFPNPNTGPLAGRAANAARLDELTRAFGSGPMGPQRGDPAPFNQNFSLSLGDTGKLLDHRVGYYASLSYDRKFNYYENGEQNRYFPDGQQPLINQQFSDSKGSEEVTWSGLVNLAYELSEGHELSFNFLFNQSAEDTARQRVGKLRNLGQLGEPPTDPDNDTWLNTLHYNERNLTAYQLKGKHDLPRAKVEWLWSMASTTQDEPDLRYLNYLSAPNPADPTGQTRAISIGDASLPQPSLPTRYYRSLAEGNRNVKLDLTVPYLQWNQLDSEFKFGGYGSFSERTFKENTYSFDGERNFIADPAEFPAFYLDPSNYGFTQNGNFYTFKRVISSPLGNNRYEGAQNIKAAYFMTDLPIVESLHFIGGARYETTDLTIASTAANLGGIFTGQIKTADWLPAAGLLYHINSNMNVRASWSQTLARPTYREFASYRSYDVTGDEILQGNPSLTLTHCENYDLRWEWFPHAGDVLSVGGFYKNLTAPIERIALDRLGDIVTYTNQPTATVFGIEFEARKNLRSLADWLEPVSLGVNFAWIASEIANSSAAMAEKLTTTGRAAKSRPLYDQSPYVLNADISYESKRSGTIVSVVFNQAGERLYLVNNTGYDVYEQPAPQLDFILSQKLGKAWKLKFSAKNLLDPEFKRIYGQAGELKGEFVYGSYRKGMTFGLSLSRDF